MLLSPTSTAGRTSRVLLADVIPWINKISLALYSMHHATTNLKFGSYTMLSSSSTVIEASKLVPVEIETDSISAIEVPAIDVACTILTTFYHIHH